MNSVSTHLVPAFAAAALIIAAGTLFAGPLSPPAGAIASTYKTLTEVQPRTAISTANTPGDGTSVYIISQPGSYYLTGNISVPSGKSGIKVTAAGVHIDLSGFAILGVPGSVSGIVGTGTSQQIHVHDGTIATMGGRGLDLGFNIGMIVEKMFVRGCAGEGIYLASGSTVSSCDVQECLIGIEVGYDCTVRNCAVRNCTTSGYYINQGSTVEDCTSGFNTTHGFRAFSGSVLRGCIAQSNFVDGFNLGNSATMIGCSAYSNSGDGVNADIACRIEDCTSHENNGDGFEVGAQTEVRASFADGNGGAGILLAGSNASADGNTCRSNSAYGVRATITGCMVVRNTVMAVVAGSVNYSLVVGTRNGPIVNLPGAAAAVNVSAGGSAASNLGSTDPYANFSY